jgi:hypothetical protein
MLKKQAKRDELLFMLRASNNEDRFKVNKDFMTLSVAII